MKSMAARMQDDNYLDKFGMIVVTVLIAIISEILNFLAEPILAAMLLAVFIAGNEAFRKIEGFSLKRETYLSAMVVAIAVSVLRPEELAALGFSVKVLGAIESEFGMSDEKKLIIKALCLVAVAAISNYIFGDGLDYAIVPIIISSAIASMLASNINKKSILNLISLFFLIAVINGLADPATTIGVSIIVAIALINIFLNKKIFNMTKTVAASFFGFCAATMLIAGSAFLLPIIIALGIYAWFTRKEWIYLRVAHGQIELLKIAAPTAIMLLACQYYMQIEGWYIAHTVYWLSVAIQAVGRHYAVFGDEIRGSELVVSGIAVVAGIMACMTVTDHTVALFNMGLGSLMLMISGFIAYKRKSVELLVQKYLKINKINNETYIAIVSTILAVLLKVLID